MTGAIRALGPSRRHRFRRRRAFLGHGSSLALLLGASLLLVSCSDGDGTGPGGEEGAYLVRPVSGDRQVALPGNRLLDPLVVEVYDVESSLPVPGVRVLWELVRGGGATFEPAEAVTDSAGRTSTRVRLGAEVGSYVFRASVGGSGERWFDFQARALEAMVLDSLVPGEVAPGDTVTLWGSGFLSPPDSTVVLFSGIRGEVLSVDPSRARVAVPGCLPPREVAVSAGLGPVRSGDLPLNVGPGGSAAVLGLGEDLTLEATGASPCVRLSEPGSYLLVVQTPAPQPAYRFDMVLSGLSWFPPVSGSPEPVAPGVLGPHRGGRNAGSGRPVGSGLAVAPGAAAQRWKAVLREEVERALSGGSPRPTTDPGAAMQSDRPWAIPPELGHLRDFQVRTRDGAFDTIQARAEWVGEEVALYLDLDSPEPVLGSGDLAYLGQLFDDPVHRVVSGAFGEPPDLDGNRRIVVLLTPAVNRLSRPEDGGTVGGFFFGVDLLPAVDGSNGGEILYALVPDPEGVEGPAVTVEEIRAAVPPVLAHEYQHMIHFFRRVVVGGAGGQDVLWLSEGMAHMAEDLVSQELGSLGIVRVAWDFLVGNLARGEQYLLAPDSTTALQSLGPGSLAERGADWLFVRYLRERFAEADLLYTLTGSTLSGVASLEAATGVPFEMLFSDWGTALFADGLRIGVDPVLEYPDTDLRLLFSAISDTYPLVPDTVAYGDFSLDREQVGGVNTFVSLEVAGAPGEGIALGLGGPWGGPSDPAGALRVRIVRVR